MILQAEDRAVVESALFAQIRSLVKDCRIAPCLGRGDGAGRTALQSVLHVAGRLGMRESLTRSLRIWGLESQVAAIVKGRVAS